MLFVNKKISVGPLQSTTMCGSLQKKFSADFVSITYGLGNFQKQR